MAAAGTLVLAGCGTSPGGTGPEAETSRGPITFAMGKNDTDKLTPIIESWNAAHPNEKVTLKELPGEADDQRDTLVQSLQASSGDYDVMALDAVWTAQFAAHRWIAPLEGDLFVDTSALLPATVESASYRGSLYAAPQNTNAQLLYYRTDLVPKAPENWAELTGDCAVARAANIDCLATQLKQYEGLTVAATEFIDSWGGAVVADDGTTPEVDSPKSQEGLQALVDAYRNHEIPERATSFTEEETNFAFVDGETLFAYNWPYMYANAEKAGSAVQGKVGIAPIVGPDGIGASTLGGYNNAINAFSENKATARDFIEYIESPENQRSFAEKSFSPVLAATYDDAALIAEQPYLPALKTALEHAKPRPGNPFYASVSKGIQDNTYAALTGKKSVDGAAADMAKAIEEAGS
jgi:multiple sugar transport system substrate-binding protein